MAAGEQYTYQFPTWALGALINSDWETLDDEDAALVRAFLRRENYIDIWTVDSDSEPYFCRWPEFGLACDVVDVIGIVLPESRP